MEKTQANKLLKVLIEEKKAGLKGGIYHKTQVIFAYNSNHIEGSTLTEEQTRYIYETNTLGMQDSAINVDDIIETANHFRCFDYILDNVSAPLSEELIKQLHFILKTATSDSRKDWFNVGEYKKLPNEVGGKETTSPKNVQKELQKLLENYNKKPQKTFEDIVEFHQAFESIHPFQDGNGRVGRLVAFKECLANDIVPFVITEHLRYYYYRGLKEWENEKGFLIDTCLSGQDYYKKFVEYFLTD
ncbi:MAG: Fic family protein [Clostridia bacterium]|nr:Fic family protein [Clostridia bacterium]